MTLSAWRENGETETVFFNHEVEKQKNPTHPYSLMVQSVQDRLKFQAVDIFSYV